MIPKTSKWLLRAFDEGLISDLDGFQQFLESHNLIITTATIECLNNIGRIRPVSIDSSKIFTCCSCSSASCNKTGKICTFCKNRMCINCSNGQIVHLCSSNAESNLQENTTTT